MPESPETRLLFVGDMHLGRVPGGLPASRPAADLGPREAWARVVDEAIARKAHCVALAGDLVNHDHDMFEAFGLLEQGILRLGTAGIQVCAVAGNHDTRVLPELAQRLPGLHLLGREGAWSTFTLDPPDGPRVRLAGWSFPRPHHRSNPLASAPPPPEPGLVTVGLLHCDLDQTGSPYAPVSRAELAAVGFHRWCLGHVHLPDPVPADATPFYLGSLSPLSCNEQGLHGPVLMRVSGADAITAERLPLAPLRWEEARVDCAGLDPAADRLAGLIVDAVTSRSRAIEHELDQVKFLGFKAVLTGRVTHPRAVARTVARLQQDKPHIPGAGRELYVASLRNRTGLAHDLPGLAAQDHPAGLLARQILVLREGPAEAREELLLQARSILENVDLQEVFGALRADEQDEPVNERVLTQLLLDTANEALDHLVTGREGGHAADQA